MVKQYLLNEDNLPPKLPVVYSDDVMNEIEYIRQRNLFEKEGLSRLFSHIKGIENHISNRAIAFGYGSNYTMDSNEITYVYDMGVVFCVKDDSEKVFIEISWIYLNLEDFGLQENRNINISRIITETINSYLRKNLLLVN
ncbi:MAG: hypothetical protein J6U14_00820 [Bacteroidaceae bacterium]|jgi:hypothetical protein|nr:hypothetical protein [Bacteroidaceae bacterium]